MQRGFLIKKANGRYGIVVTELTSGQPVQIFIDGELKKGRIEHNGKDYYFLDNRNKSYDLKNDMEILFD